MGERLLIWDFDGTLATRPEGWTGAILETLQAMGLDVGVTRENLRPHLRSGFPWHEPSVRAPMSADDWWSGLDPVLLRAMTLGGGLPTQAAEGALPGIRRSYLRIESWQLYEDSLQALTELGGDGWSHVILSNHVPELPGIVEGLGLSTLIDDVYSSGSTGAEKPCREVFEAVLVNHPSRKAVVIGDSLRADIQGADSAGLPSVLFRNPDAGAKFQAQSLEELLTILGTI
jgi:putative hydrolase of the HAD superfamily